MRKLVLQTLLLVLPVAIMAQQDKNTPKTKTTSISFFTGGMLINRSALSVTKIGIEKKHWGVIADFTYDTYYEKWSDGSKSSFRLPAAGIAGRYYLKPLGRSFYAEVFGGLARPELSTKESNTTKLKKDWLPITGYGFGWRLGKKPTGIFGEAGLRISQPLKELHLYTTNTKPDTRNIENISYQSWYFKNGKNSAQIYIGIGYSL